LKEGGEGLRMWKKQGCVGEKKKASRSATPTVSNRRERYKCQPLHRKNIRQKSKQLVGGKVGSNKEKDRDRGENVDQEEDQPDPPQEEIMSSL